MNKYLFSLFFLFFLNICAGQSEEDRSQSPYFLVTSDGTQVESFPLLSTVAEVNIAGVIADVTVRQTYKNDSKQAIEAIYVFPASTRAAVYGMQMKVGGRVIVAEIKEKQEARRVYEVAKQEGRRASLLEQERPNVFQMNVANIMPGDQVEVELYYTELLVPEQKTYQFVFPTVVGPRFVSGTEEQNTSFAASPYLPSDKLSPYEFDISVYVNGGMPVQDIQSNTHQIEVRAAGKSSVEIKLAPEEAISGNKDFILDFSFAGDQIESGLLLYDDGEEKFFLCMAQPPKQVAPKQVPDREYIFVMDVSGSMNGFPLDVSKQLMSNLVNQLHPTDKFNILFFAGASNLWQAQSQAATPENLKTALDFMQNVRGGGGTRLLPALQKAMNLERQSEALSRSIVIITDGYVGVENETFELIRSNLNKTNVFSFGIGSSVNRHLIEGMAHAGQGIPFIVTDKNEAFKQAQRLRSYIQNPVMTQIEARFPGLDVYDVEPKTIPDVLSERPVILFGKYKGKAKGEIYLEGT
ncbi:MAG: VIT domain-containing protein, partial [Bacteroidota bacterium]